LGGGGRGRAYELFLIDPPIEVLVHARHHTLILPIGPQRVLVPCSPAGCAQRKQLFGVDPPPCINVKPAKHLW
jgi:hypothetical protein